MIVFSGIKQFSITFHAKKNQREAFRNFEKLIWEPCIDIFVTL